MSSFSTLKSLKIWKDCPVYILAGGPSISSQNLDLIKDKIVVGVNNSYQFGNWIDAVWFGDPRWFHWWWESEKPLKDFPNLICTCAPSSFPKRVIPFERADKKFGISDKEGTVCWNSNSGASCIDFCIKMGASSVVLLGFDMTTEKNLTHWHGGHKQSSFRAKPSSVPYPRFLQAFPFIKKDADKLGIPIINASPISVIPDFQRLSLEECVKVY